MTHDDRKVLWYKMLQQNQIAEQQIVVETQVERSESEMDRNRFLFLPFLQKYFKLLCIKVDSFKRGTGKWSRLCLMATLVVRFTQDLFVVMAGLVLVLFSGVTSSQPISCRAGR